MGLAWSQRGWQKSCYLLGAVSSLRALNPVVTACASALRWRRALHLANNAVALLAACGAVDMAGNLEMLQRALVQMEKACQWPANDRILATNGMARQFGSHMPASGWQEGLQAHNILR